MKTRTLFLLTALLLISCKKEPLETLTPEAPVENLALETPALEAFPDSLQYVAVRKQFEQDDCQYPACSFEIKKYRAALQQLANERCQVMVGDLVCCMDGRVTYVLFIVEPDKKVCLVEMAPEEQVIHELESRQLP